MMYSTLEHTLIFIETVLALCLLLFLILWWKFGCSSFRNLSTGNRLQTKLIGNMQCSRIPSTSTEVLKVCLCTSSIHTTGISPNVLVKFTTAAPCPSFLASNTSSSLPLCNFSFHSLSLYYNTLCCHFCTACHHSHIPMKDSQNWFLIPIPIYYPYPCSLYSSRFKTSLCLETTQRSLFCPNCKTWK